MTNDSLVLSILLDMLDPQAVIGTDAQGRITHWNRAAARLLEWSASEAIGRMRQEVLESAVDGLAAGEADITRPFRTRTGALVYAETRTQPLRDEAGAIAGYVIVLNDAASRHSEAEFIRAVLAASDDCIKLLDLDANLTFMSEGGQRVMEVSDFNLIRGCAWPDFWSGEGRQKAEAAVAQAKAGRTARFQGEAKTVAGTVRYWDVKVSPVFGIDGKPEALLSISRDITGIGRAPDAG